MLGGGWKTRLPFALAVNDSEFILSSFNRRLLDLITTGATILLLLCVVVTRIATALLHPYSFNIGTKTANDQPFFTEVFCRSQLETMNR